MVWFETNQLGLMLTAKELKLKWSFDLLSF